MRLGVFGGSFNPIHVGHLRIALEVGEACNLDRVDMVPVASPPHKSEAEMLPFQIRLHLLKLAVKPVAGRVNVSEIEAVLPEPSYTFRTLQKYRNLLPSAELFFIVGAGDLLAFPHWHRGEELVRFANIVVVPRFGVEREAVVHFVRKFWPEARPESAENASWRFSGGTQLLFFPVSRLQISSSDLRNRWRSGKSLTFLVPEAVEVELMRRRAEIEDHWGCRSEERDAVQTPLDSNTGSS